MKMLTVKQAAEILGVHRSRVRVLIREGRLPAQKVGRDWIILKPDLELVQDRKPGRPMKQRDGSMKPKSVEKTAYHEAGHAVAAFHMRRSFRYVTIEPDEESLGHVMYTKFSDSFRPDIDSDRKIRKPLEKAIITAFAGPIAEQIFSGRKNPIGASRDFHSASDYVSYLCVSSEESEAYINWLWIKTKKMIMNPTKWCSVKRLAEELLDCRRIGYVKARKIIKESMAREVR